MDLDINSLLRGIAIWTIPVLLAVTVHEVAHGWTAFRLGDNTAKDLGRLTLNPIKHMDMIGTVLLPITLLILSAPFLFGWAKPVPVMMNKLRQPRRDMAIVAFAGPFSNVLMAIGWAIVIKISLDAGASSADLSDNWLFQIGRAGLIINCALAVLNMLPLLPLDGGRIIHSMLPPRLADGFAQTENYGFFILLFLLISGLLGKILQPMIALLLSFIVNLFGL